MYNDAHNTVLEFHLNVYLNELFDASFSKKRKVGHGHRSYFSSKQFSVTFLVPINFQAQ